MKTKIASLAATLLAMASFSSFAMAGQNFPVKRQTSGPAAKSATCCALPKGGECRSCCRTKTVINGTFAGRGSNRSLKKVHTCKMGAATAAAAGKGACCN